MGVTDARATIPTGAALMSRLVSTFIVVALLSSFPGPASGLEPRDSVNARAIRELHAKNPGAESSFAEALAAEQRNDLASAARLYHQVGELVPGYVVAMRREGFALIAIGQRARGLDLIRSAAAREPSALGLYALARALIWVPGGGDPPAADLEQAAIQARAAMRLDSTDVDVADLVCHLALVLRNLHDLRAGVAILERHAPDSLNTHMYAFIANDAAGDAKAARRSLERAHALGLPDGPYREALASLQGGARHQVLVGAAWGAAIWLGMLVLLLVAGLALSAATLRRARTVPDTPEGEVRGADAWLRRLYRLVLWVSCAYYYLSMPVVVVLVLAAAGGLIYAFFAMGQVPVKLVLFVALLALVTVWVTVRSVFVRGRDEDPGMRLALGREPRLGALLERVAAKIGTRPVETVFLTPGAELAVFERGGMLRQLRGGAERCLILGLGVIDGMALGPFRAVLAHEYGHFSNRDTAGGGFALAVRRSLLTMAVGLAAGGAAAWYNPAWLFVNGFHRVFMRVSQGASRLQEVLADRWAALAYGARAFEAGLRHVIEASVRFDAHVNATLQEVIEQKRPLPNLYRFQPLAARSQQEVAEAIEQALRREPSAYDSHPAPADRIAWVHRLATPEAESSADDRDPVWSVFEDRDELERLMTAEIRKLVHERHGVEIAGGEPPATPAPA